MTAQKGLAAITYEPGTPSTSKTDTVTLPHLDIVLAAHRELTFKACAKNLSRGPWLTLLDDMSLADAFEAAQSRAEEYPEVGVFVRSATGGMLYWTSRTPELFNSIVLQEGYS